MKHYGFVIYEKIDRFCSSLVSFLLPVTKHTSLDKYNSLLGNL